MEKIDYKIKYEGALRTTSIHLRSGEKINTDAPVDNNGKGSAFSPTDLVAVSLATCMLTVVGIYFDKRDRKLSEIRCDVAKRMASDPRRIAEISIVFDFCDNVFNEDDFKAIKRVAMSCPVANSLSPEIIIATNLSEYPD